MTVMNRRHVNNLKKDRSECVFIHTGILVRSFAAITGLAGFEPANVGVKVLCLTPWR